MFENFSINKHKYLKFPKSGSMRQLQEIISLNDIPLNETYASQHDNLHEVFENIFYKRRLEYPYSLVEELIGKSKPVILELKNYHDRERPNVGAKRWGIKLNYFHMDSAQTPSFPSGHSAQAKLVANVLSDMYPMHTAELQQAAENISNSRLVSRVHYKSDTEAGKKLGDDLYNHYKKVPKN